ncbi:MAG: ABC transporter ATP-binding protein, partial [Anaerolineales bacterium]
MNSTNLWERFQKAASQLPYFPRAFRILWESSRNWTLAWVVLLILHGLLPAATVYMTRALVDSLVEIAGAGENWETAVPTLALAAAMGGILLLSEIMRAVLGWIRAAQSEKVQDHVTNLIHRKCVQVDLAFYETPAYYDHLHRARSEARHRPIQLLESAGSLLQGSVTLVAMAAVLVPYGLLLPLVLLIGMLPALSLVLRHGARLHSWSRHATADERHAWYYDWLFATAQAAAEIRLFGLGDRFRSAYQDIRKQLRRQRLRLTKQQGLTQIQASLMGVAIMGTAMVWMLWRAISGLVTLGDLALFYQALVRLQGTLHVMV